MSAETTTFIIDVSASMLMDQKLQTITAYLEYTLLDKIKRKRKTDYLSVYLSNYYGHSKNSQDIPDIYQLQGFAAPVTMNEAIETLKVLRNISHIKNDNVSQEESSMLQCLLVTSLDIKDHFGKRKLHRQIVICTDDINGLDITPDELNILKDELESSIIFIDCSDPKKNIFKGSNWDIFISSLEGSMYYQVDEILKLIDSPILTPVKPVKIFTGKIRLGADVLGEAILNNTENADIKRKFEYHDDIGDNNCISFYVEGFPATKVVSNLNMKTVLKLTGNMNTNEYGTVQSVIEYMIQNDQQEEIESEVDKKKAEEDTFITISPNSISKGYRYGSDYVVLPSLLHDQMYLHNKANIDIRGFMNENLLPRYYLNSESKFIFFDSKNGNKSDFYSLYALVDVMIENKKVAIVRYIPKPNSEVEMCMLYPMETVIETTEEEQPNKIKYFIINRLPFAEDERISDFPKLQNRLTTSGKKIQMNTEKEEHLIDEMMGKFIDSMDITNKSIDKDLYYRPAETNNNTSTTLPLPNKDKQLNTIRDEDPMLIHAINLHAQKFTINKYIHEKYFQTGTSTTTHENKTDEFITTLMSKIKPYNKDQTLTKELKQLLKIKKIIPKSTDTKTNSTTPNSINIPSFEELMSRGKRDTT